MEFLRVHSRGVDPQDLTKSASLFTRAIQDLRPVKGRTYLHFLALGDGEAYGANRNGDYFPKKANMAYHDTFVKYGRVYKNHENKDPKKSSGEIISSAHNTPMSRVELIAAVDNDKWGPELHKIAQGEDVPVSMSCIVPYDYCSICDNAAKTRRDYCEHLKSAMCSVLNDGRQVYAINREPKFFDLSSVVRQADRIAYTLRKVAGEDIPLGGAELAERFQLHIPHEVLIPAMSPSLRKKAEAVGSMLDDEVKISRGLSKDKKVGDTPEVTELFGMRGGVPKGGKIDIFDADSRIPNIKSAFFTQKWSALVSNRIALPPREFFKIAMGADYKHVEKYMPEVESALPGMFHKLGEARIREACQNTRYDALPGHSPLPCSLAPLATEFSLSKEAFTNRMINSIVSGENIVVKSGKCGRLTKEAETLLDEYAAYKISLATNLDDLERKFSVLQHYLV